MLTRLKHQVRVKSVVEPKAWRYQWLNNPSIWDQVNHIQLFSHESRELIYACMVLALHLRCIWYVCICLQQNRGLQTYCVTCRNPMLGVGLTKCAASLAMVSTHDTFTSWPWVGAPSDQSCSFTTFLSNPSMSCILDQPKRNPDSPTGNLQQKNTCLTSTWPVPSSDLRNPILPLGLWQGKSAVRRSALALHGDSEGQAVAAGCSVG